MIARGKFLTARVVWTTRAGLIFWVSGCYMCYVGIADTFDHECLMINAPLFRKVFKSRAERSYLAINDFLNQNESFTCNITNAYMENVTSKTIGRYLCINFISNLPQCNQAFFSPLTPSDTAPGFGVLSSYDRDHDSGMG